MSSTRIALVTGSNKGIGLAIVELLCEQFEGKVLLAARDVARGQKAVEELQSKGFNPEFIQLDIDDEASIKECARKLQEQYGGLDVLINNAAIYMDDDKSIPFATVAETTIRVNFTGIVNVCKHLFPLLRSHARVVNVSSGYGMLSYITNQELRNRFTSDELTVEELEKLMQCYVDLAREDRHITEGWPEDSYGTSKVGVTALSRVQQRVFDSDPREDIVVNACTPGFVDTDMTKHKGALTPAQGADTPVYLALLPPGIKEPRGLYMKERKIVEWVC